MIDGVPTCKCEIGKQGDACNIDNCEGYTGCGANGILYIILGECTMSSSNQRTCTCKKGWTGDTCTVKDCAVLHSCGPNGMSINNIRRV